MTWGTGDGILKIVNETTGAVLFDFDDADGSSNPRGIGTRMDDLDLGTAEHDESTFAGSAPGERVTSRVPRRARLRFRLYFDPYASVDDAVSAGNSLALLLEAGGVMRYQLPGSSAPAFIDFLPTALPPLLRGQRRGMLKIIKLLQDSDGLELEIRRQPLLREASLDPAEELLANALLLLDNGGNGVPDGWTSVAGTHSVEGASDAYRNSHTAVSDLLRQDATVVNGQTYTLTGQARRVSGAGAGRVRLLAQGGVATVDSQDITNAEWPAGDEPNVELTLQMDSATARVVFRQHAASGTTVLEFRRMHLHLGAAPTSPRVKEHTASNDPANLGRAFPIVVNGSEKAPVKFTAKIPDASPAVSSLILGIVPDEGKGRRLADYINETSVCQADASGRGWTRVTTGLSPAVTVQADADASGGSAVQDGPNVYYVKTGRWTRTTKLDALLGAEVFVYARVNLTPTVTNDFQDFLQLRWAPSTTAPVQPVPETSVRVGEQNDASRYYEDVLLGSFRMPDRASGLALELWSRINDSSTGATLRVDFLTLIPVHPNGMLARLELPVAADPVMLGKSLTTPIGNPAGTTAGVISGTDLNLDTTTDAAGLGANAGEVLTIGRHRWTWRLTFAGSIGSSAVIRLREITPTPGNHSSLSIGKLAAAPETRVIEAQVADSDLYQMQIDDPSTAGLLVHEVLHEFLPALAQNQRFRTDPEKLTAEAEDSSGSLLFPWVDTPGGVPGWIPPGLSAVVVIPGDIPKVAHYEPHSVLARTVAVSAAHAPRRHQ